MSAALTWILFTAGWVVLPAPLYLAYLAWLARARKPSERAAPKLRFTIVIPAHNEEANIGATVRSALDCDYPAELRSVVVVADNCSDKTAETAHEAGATVLIRNHATDRGKGFALDFAFKQVVNDCEAVVVIDADTLVSSNLLLEFNDGLLGGAKAMQAEYGVQNPEASWRTKLMVVALALFHRTRSLARERLQLSSGLRGNGMCFTCEVLTEVPHEAHGLVEDVEYGVALGRKGIRVTYAQDACVWGEMVSRGKEAASQRRRWEEGRRHLVREVGITLLKDAITKRDRILFDLAMDIFIPPLSKIVIIVTLGWLLSCFTNGWVLLLWTFQALCLALYLLRGIQHSGLGMKAVAALAYAPIYIVWKLTLGRSSSREWVRTTREAKNQTPPPADPQ